MEEIDNNDGEKLLEPENSDEDSQNNDSKDQSSAKENLQPSEPRRKRNVFANKEHKAGHFESEEENKSEVEGEHKSGEKDNKDKSSKGGDSSNSSSSEDNQSQRIIQFSSGQSVNFGSLMNLITSTVILKAESAVAPLVSQTIVNPPDQSISLGSTRNDSASIQTQINNIAITTEKTSENITVKNTLDTSARSLQTTQTQTIQGSDIVDVKIDTNNDQDPPDVTVISAPNIILTGTQYIPVFNTNSFFFQPETQFVFSSTDPSINNSVVQSTSSTTYSNILNQYFKDANLTVAPAGFAINTTNQVLPTGVTYSLSGPANILVATYSTSVINNHVPETIPILSFNLTGPDAGSMVVSSPNPVSLVIGFQSGNGDILPLRIDVGPGNFITNNTAEGGNIVTLDPSLGSTVEGSISGPSVISIVDIGNAADNAAIVGNTVNYTVNNTLDDQTISLPSNVIYSHIGDSLSNISTTGAYGNFYTGNIDLSNGDTVNLGGNILDVFGTKYGIGQKLALNVGNGTSTINFGEGSPNAFGQVVASGNTLAGFGIGYGDFQTLELNYTTASSPQTNINFISNTLTVDKAIDSTLYPDIQNLDLTGTVKGLTINFSNTTTTENGIVANSFLQGNSASNTFYGNIQNVGDLGNSSLYNGFITGVNVISGQQNPNTNQTIPTNTVAVEDANGNVIEFSNDVYTGGVTQVGTTGIATNTYNFTLLGDQTVTGAQPIQEGNALITNFNVHSDNLVFQLTPALFLALDGLDGNGYTKSISVADLMKDVNNQYFKANNSLDQNPVYSSVTGTAINFSGGGSITLEGLDLTPAEFANLNISFEVNYSYQPMVGLSPTSLPIFGNGGEAQSNNIALDQFFSNSLFATYTVQGLPPGVTIDQYGNITVANHNAFIGNITVTATDLPDSIDISSSQTASTASQTMLVGFLDAPEELISSGSTGTVVGAASSNIIDDSAINATIVGSSGNTPDASGNANADRTIQASQLVSNPSYGGNLIIDVVGGSTVYGTNEAISIVDQATITAGVPQSQSVAGETVTFNGNALDVQGTAYGIANTLSLNVQGASGGTAQLIQGELNGSAVFNNNNIIYGPQIIYGSGTLYGDAQNLEISVKAGINNTLTGTLPATGSADFSSTVEGNNFVFDPVQTTVQGDAVGDQTTIYTNIQNLSIAVEPSFSKVISTTYNINEGATFSNNNFVFEGGTFTGGQGNTTFFAAPNLNSIAASSQNGYAYAGFIDPILVNGSSGNIVTTTTDGLFNSITWGNNVFVGGEGVNTYNFTLLDNAAGTYVNNYFEWPFTLEQSSFAVFTGNDIIKNFHVGKDVITLNLEPNLYNQLLQNVQQNYGYISAGQATLLDLSGIATFSYSNGNTVITFGLPGQAQGSLTLDGVYIQNFTQLGSSLVVNEVNSAAYVPPSYTAVPFDPVFLDASQPGAFEGLINTNTTNLQSLNYSTASSLPTGVVLETNGTLDISGVTAPESIAITPIATDLTTGDSVTLPTERILVSNASSITYDTASGVGSVFNANGTANQLNAQAGAYEVQAATVYGISSKDNQVDLSKGAATEQSQLIYDSSTGTSATGAAHTIYGDTQDITETSSSAISGQHDVFGANLIDVNVGITGLASGVTGPDQIFGNAQNLTIAPIETGSFENNSFTYGPNTVYATGSVYANLQVVDLDATHGTAVISGNTFAFGANNLTSGAYIGGSNTLTGDTATTNLYPGIGTLEISGNVTGNSFNFSNSILTGVGPTNFYADIGDLSRSDFVLAVSETNISSGNVKVIDQAGNSIVFGNDTFIAGSDPNSFNFTILASEQGTGATATFSPTMEGNATIQGFNSQTDNLVLNIAAPLYNSLIQEGSNATLTAAKLNSLSSWGLEAPGTNNNGVDFYFYVDTANNSTTIFMKGGGSIILDGEQIINFTGFQHLKIGYAYDPVAITTNAAPVQPIIFNGLTTNYAEFSAYFNNVNVMNSGTSYTISSAVPEINISNASPSSLFSTPAATNTPVLELVNVGMNDVNNSSNHPAVTALVGYFNGNNAVQSGSSMVGNAAGGSGELFQGVANDILQGNMGNVTQATPNDTYEQIITTSQTTANTQAVAGNNMFIDTAGGTTAYGDFKSIVYTDSNSSSGIYDSIFAQTPPTELDIKNQTYTYASNAFDVGGTIEGVASSFQQTVSAGNNIFDLNSTADSADTVVSNNTYNFDGETIFGNGTIYGDFNTLSIALNAGNNDTELGTGTLSVSASFTHNTFNFEANQMVVLEDTSLETTTVYPNLQSLSVTLDSSIIKVTSINQVVPSVDFADNAFVFGNATVVGGQGNMVIQADPNLNNVSPNAYNGFIDPISVSTNGSSNIITTTTDGLSNSITWGNNTFVSGEGTNTYNFTLLDNASGTYVDGKVGTPNVAGTDTYAVFTGNDTVVGFKLGTDVITLNLEPNLYNQIIQAVQNNFGFIPAGMATTLDLAGIAQFKESGGNTLITFGTEANSLGSLLLEGVSVQSFTQLGLSLVVNEAPTPGYVAPSVNTGASFDPVFLNNTAQPEAFEGLVSPNTTHALSLSYTTTSSLPTGVILDTNGTLDISGVTMPESIVITPTATDLTTGDSITLPTERILVSNASMITYNTTSGTGSSFSGSGTTPGAYEVQAATVYGAGSGAVDLSKGPVTEQSQLIYDSSTATAATGAAHTIYGDTQDITETSSSAISDQHDVFGANLIDVNVGITGSATGTTGLDHVYGNAQNLTIAPIGTGSFENNSSTYGPNTIYATGSVYGNLQVLNLDAGTATIFGNTFNFSANTLTSGAYVGGSNIPIGDTAATNLFAGVGTLEISGNASDNLFIFGNSNLTGVGNTNFYADIANLTQSTFELPVTVTSTSSGNILVTDQNGNQVTFGNDIFTGGGAGTTNSYNFVLLDNVSGTSTATANSYAVLTGNETITNFGTGTNSLVLNLEPNLYNQILKVLGTTGTLTGAMLDQAEIANFTQSGANTVITFGLLGASQGSITLDGMNVTSFAQLGSGLVINEVAIPGYVAPTPATAPAIDFMFVNGQQPEVFENIVSSTATNQAHLTYTATGLPTGVTLSPDGTLTTTGITAPASSVVTVTATDPATLDSVTFSERIFLSNASTVTTDTQTGIGSSFSGSGTTPGAYEVQAATMYGAGSSPIDLSTGTTANPIVQQSQLIYDSSTVAHTIYGDTETIVDTSSSAVTKQADSFDANLIFAHIPLTQFDQLYGNAQTLVIDPSGSGSFGNNTVSFGPNSIYGSGIVYGNLQTFTLDTSSGTTTISSNTFNFGANTIDMTGSSSNNTLYGNVGNLVIQAGYTATDFTGNIVTFGDDTLVGGSGSNQFYGHAQNFGSSENSQVYGSENFFDGVIVSTTKNAAGEQIMTIQDGNDNTITWGDDIYTGSTTSPNVYNFTIVGNNAATPQAVMQGFDTVTNFNLATDKIALTLSYPVYASLEGSAFGGLTDTALFNQNGISITQTATAAILNFAGGGSITLDGYGTASTYTPQSLQAAIISYNSFTITVADPVTSVQGATPEVVVVGNTVNPAVWNNYYNTGHNLSVTLDPDGNPVDSIVTNADGSVVFNGASATGITNTTVSSIVASDASGTAVTSSASVQVLALDGTVINNTGTEQGTTATDVYGTEAEVFIGHGSATITGGIESLDYNSSAAPTAPGTTLVYQDKLIYDGSGHTDTVYGDTQSIVMTNDGSAAGTANTSNQAITTGSNLIEASGTIYANVENINITATPGSSAPNHNAFVFGDATIVAQSNTSNTANEIYGHAQNFGNSNSPSAEPQNFYEGVTVSTMKNAAGEQIMTIQDGNNNTITWGDDIYTGSTTSPNVYNFTIVGNNAATSQAVMQGFDIVKNFNLATDKIALALSYPVYAALEGTGTKPLTGADLFSSGAISIATLGTNSVVLAFAGGGSIDLNGLSSGFTKEQITNAITVSVADPITPVESPIDPTLVMGQTMGLSQWASLINTSHYLSSTVNPDGTGNNDIVINATGSVTYNGTSSSGIIETTVNSITASDDFTTVTTNTSASNPVEVYALNAPITDQATGTETGSTAAGIFMGSGNQIIGGGADITYQATGGQTLNGASAPVTYQERIIEDTNAQGTGSITGDVQNVVMTATGTNDAVGTSTTAPTDPINILTQNTTTFDHLVIISNTNSPTYGNVENIEMTATGGSNIYNAIASINDSQTVSNNAVTTGGNTVTASGDIYGVAQNISYTATDGFYSAASGSADTAFITGNIIQTGGNILTAQGSGQQTLYGDAQTVSMTISSPAATSGVLNEATDFSNAVSAAKATVNEGNSLVENNTFNFAGNTLVGGTDATTLVAGVGQLNLQNDEQAITNATQPQHSAITNNAFIFGNSTESATGGVTNMYGDVADLSNTNFYNGPVTVKDVSGHVQITDQAGAVGTNAASEYGNYITFGNDTMNGNANGMTVFNVALLVDNNNNVVTEGNTTINNFTANPANILNLQISQPLYTDIIDKLNGGATTQLTPSMLNQYILDNNGSITESNGNTIINFGDAAKDNLGSITLTGVQATSLEDFGHNLAITSNGSVYMNSYGTNTINVPVVADSASSFTQNVIVANTDNTGHLLTYDSGNLNLVFSQQFAQAVGMSSANTDQQNIQILENSVNGTTGGIAVSTNVTGTGTNAVTNTLLSFESTAHGVLNTYGTVLIEDFNANTTPLTGHATEPVHIIIKTHK